MEESHPILHPLVYELVFADVEPLPVPCEEMLIGKAAELVAAECQIDQAWQAFCKILKPATLQPILSQPPAVANDREPSEHHRRACSDASSSCKQLLHKH